MVAKRLRDLRTVSDLLQELVKLGYTSIPSREPCELTPNGARFEGREVPANTWQPSCNHLRQTYGIRYIAIYPDLGDQTGDVYAAVNHSPEGELIETTWAIKEIYVGSEQRLAIDTTRLDQLQGQARAWITSWEVQ